MFACTLPVPRASDDCSKTDAANRKYSELEKRDAALSQREAAAELAVAGVQQRQDALAEREEAAAVREAAVAGECLPFGFVCSCSVCLEKSLSYSGMVDGQGHLRAGIGLPAIRTDGTGWGVAYSIHTHLPAACARHLPTHMSVVLLQSPCQCFDWR